MSDSLKHRFKSHAPNSCHGAMSLTSKELKQGFAYRVKRTCELYFRVGDVRKANDRWDGCSLGAKIEITRIAFDKKARRTKVSFKVMREKMKSIEVDWER